MKDGRISGKSQDPADLLMAFPKGDVSKLFTARFREGFFLARDICHQDLKPSSE